MSFMAVGKSPAVARHHLRFALREAREAKGLTQRQVAASLDWSLSKINRIEAGEVTISSTDARALLHLLDITDRRRIEELMGDARASRRRGWWDQPEYREHLTPAVIQLLQFEMEATAIWSFQPQIIPGSFQTRDYATTILWQLGSDYLSEADLAARLEVRLRRREQLLNRSSPPEYLLVIDESVLLREVGGPTVMADQLYDLLGLIRAGRVVVRVLPLAPAVNYGALGQFTVYQTDNEDVTLLYRENYDTDEAGLTPESVRRHQRLFMRIWNETLSVQASVRLIEARAAILRSAADRLRSVG